MDMARLEIPVSGWTCLRTEERRDALVDGLGDRKTKPERPNEANDAISDSQG